MRIEFILKKIPLAWRSAVQLKALFTKISFKGSTDYWEKRYRRGGTSGRGSYGAAAAFKATFINRFVKNESVRSVIEFGCGDGNQLSLAVYPRYIGLDVSCSVVERCREWFKGDTTKSFFLYHPFAFVDRHGLFRAELAMSLDVIYHLVEDAIYDKYMEHLFNAATRYVVVFSTNHDELCVQKHMRHRQFTATVDSRYTEWTLVENISLEKVKQSSGAEIFVFQRHRDATKS